MPINDGEEGESTLLQIRAKLYALDLTGWKERGVGVIKLNVPKSSVELDSKGNAIPGTFRPRRGSVVETSLIARLVMRQEATHRVVLNTPVLKSMGITHKPGLKSSQILFMAFEDGKPLNVQLKVRLITIDIT